MDTEPALARFKGDQVKILLVDDKPANLIALKAMLDRPDWTLVQATSGLQALKHLLDNQFAVVLMDVQMPGLDGFETARLIRNRDRSRLTPIIFVTAVSRSEEHVYQAYSVGAVDYIFKPIVPEILRSKVDVFVELFRKNQEIKQQAAELARLSRQNELILNSAGDGMFGVDLEARVTFANPAATRGLRAGGSLAGMDVHEMLHPSNCEDGPACIPDQCKLHRALHGSQIHDVHDDLFWRCDGTTFPVEYIVTPLRAEDGTPIGAVLTMRDVTERRAAALALENERLYREANAANKAKDDFLATLSHELRTPMTSIIGWLQLLSDPTLEAEVRQEALASIRNSAKLQAQLIDDMLDVSRIVLGKFHLELSPTKLTEVVRTAVNTIQSTASDKNIQVETDISADDVRVMADGTRLRQVVLNLLSNAIKFTEAGGRVSVRVEVSCDFARVTVSDTGKGIDAEFLPRVFERLQQASGAKEAGGLGLGLAIAKHIVEAHGGTIVASSDGPGKGATFTVSLPLWTLEKRCDDPETASVRNATERPA